MEKIKEYIRRLSDSGGLRRLIIMAGAAGIALSASTVARGVVIALSGILRAVGVSLSFLSWEIGTNGELSGGRLRYYGLWQSLTMMIGFFMMLLGAWLSAQ